MSDTETRLRALEAHDVAVRRAVLALAKDALDRDPASRSPWSLVVQSIPDPDAAPAEPTPAAPATRWWVCDKKGGAYWCSQGEVAHSRAGDWDITMPTAAPHLAIEAATAEEARAEYRRRVAGGDDVAALREQVATLKEQRDYYQKAMQVQADYSVELQRIIEGLTRGEVYESETAAQHVHMARAILARAQRTEAEVARLRALAGEAAACHRNLRAAIEVVEPHKVESPVVDSLAAAARGDA
jgi:hypothetical protein